MDREDLNESEPSADVGSCEQILLEVGTANAFINVTPNSTVEEVDIKTEPPDLMENVYVVPENEKHVPIKDSADVNLRIGDIDSKVIYESEKHEDLSVNTSENTHGNDQDVPVMLDDSMVVVKQEMDAGETHVFTPEVSISYDNPKEGEDLRRSLQEEIVLKVEVEDNGYEGECPRDENGDPYQIKIELPATQSLNAKNHIPDGMIGADHITHTLDATLVGNVDSDDGASPDSVKKIRLSSQSAPDQMTQLHVYDADFQLNSITGDLLSLEQEAYGLLEAKNESKAVTHPFVCSKCPKSCRQKTGLLRHMKVHQTIERRAQGLERGRKTRVLNQKKKDLDLTKIGTSKDQTLVPYNYKISTESKKGQYRCTNCGKKYRLLLCLRRHQRNCVETKTDLEIDSAENVKGSLRKQIKAKVEKPEMKRLNGEYTCQCGKSFSRRSRLETCLRSHHPEIESSCFSCTICTKSFKEKSELNQHRKRQHVKKKFLCKFCPMDYHTQKELFDHLRIHKKVQMMEYKVISAVVEGNQVLKCFICSKTFPELSELKAHVLVDHKEPYICPLCKYSFNKIVDFATHTKSAHPEVENQSVLDVLEAFSILAEAWKCEECHVQFEDPDNLVKHQTEQHGPINKKQNESTDESSKFQFRCEDCRRTFSTLKQLTNHRDVHHTIKDASVEEKNEERIPERIPTPPPPRPMCVHCRKICNDETALASHLRLHSIERKYPCKFCDFRFATLEKRKTHLAIHTGDMKFVCFICEYRCTSENRLNYHKLTAKHLDLKQALLNGPPLEPQAPVLQPEVKKKRYSSERKKSKSSDEPSTCDICGEEFSNEEAMMKHKDTHPFIVFPNEEQPTRIFFK